MNEDLKRQKKMNINANGELIKHHPSKLQASSINLTLLLILTLSLSNINLKKQKKLP